MASQTIADLCELRLQYFKLEGNYARLRRETEMKITELHVKALEYKLPLGLSYDDVNPTPKRRDVHFNGDFYYVKLYEYGKLLDTRNLETKSERYAEDCAENWALSIFQIKKTAADNASTEGHGLRDWERSWLKEGPPKTE